MSEELYQEKSSIQRFGKAHWSVATKETRIMEGIPYTIRRSSVAKIKGNLKMTAF